MIRHVSSLLWLIALLAAMPFAAMAQGTYRINAGDVLRIEVVEDETLNRTVLVTPDGRISFPLAGSIQAGGTTIGAVQTSLVSRLAPNFSSPPTVYVSVERLAVREPTLPSAPEAPPSIDVYVMGEVAKSGKLTLEPGTTVLQAFAAMGGFSNFAATKRVQLRRRDPETGRERIYPLNYEAIMLGRSPNGTAVLADGDILLVPTRRLFE